MIKKYFSAGLLLWIPLAVTVWVLESIIRWSDSLLALLPPTMHPDQVFGFHIPGIGLVIGGTVILITGVLVANMIGQWVLKTWESFLEKIPFVRPIYSGVKQILQTILSDQTQSFKEVALIEFPRPGVWTYGFIVSEPAKQTGSELKQENLVTVFVPTAPNPTSGYVLIVDRNQLRPTSATVDEAFKFHISLGVMTPVGIKTTEVPNKSEKFEEVEL